MADVAPAAAEQHTYKFNVTMTCGGCSGAIDRVLKRLEGEYFAFCLLYHFNGTFSCLCCVLFDMLEEVTRLQRVHGVQEGGGRPL